MSIRSRGLRGPWLDVPIGIVTLCWLAIWGLWPSARVVAPVRTPRVMSMHYVDPPQLALQDRPDLYVLPRLEIVTAARSSIPMPVALPPPRAPDVFMDRTPLATLDAIATDPRVEPAWGRTSGMFPARRSPYDEAVLQAHAWHVWLSPSLRQAGMHLPVEEFVGIWDVTASFEAELSVVPAPPENPVRGHVFLERGSGLRDLDRSLIHRVRRLVDSLRDFEECGTVIIGYTRAVGIE